MVQLSKIGRIQATNDTAGATQMRVEWKQTVDELMDQVCEWVRQHKEWSIVPQSDKEIAEDPLGAYTVPVMRILTENGTVVLEPIARNVRGSDGRVDLYAYPTLFRVKLIYRESDQTWTVRTDQGWIGRINGVN